MSKPLPTSDFRAVRIVLESDDFAVSSGKPDVPTDLIDKDTWFEITHLPDDVSIRTSNHHGALLRELHQLQGVWVSVAIGDEQDLLFEVMLYTIDELDAVIFNALHGYYRQSIGCLRNILELVAFGTYCQISGNTVDFEKWQNGQKQTSFKEACDKLMRIEFVQLLETHFRITLSDNIFAQKNNTSEAGWARRLCDELCTYSHSRPHATNVGMWQSNGPIYVPRAFQITASLFSDVSALSYLLIKLARPDFTLPKDIRKLFQSYRRLKENIAYEAYRYLFSSDRKA